MIVLLSSTYAQSHEVFEKIQEQGLQFVSRIKKGDILFLKDVYPTPGTWLYEDLEAYKNDLDNDEDIIYGSIIQPSLTNENIFTFNYFSKKVGKTGGYYFVSIVTFEIRDKEIVVLNNYLFTEEEPLKHWWLSIFDFYQSNKKNLIPAEFLFKVCPPPPRF